MQFLSGLRLLPVLLMVLLVQRQPELLVQSFDQPEQVSGTMAWTHGQSAQPTAVMPMRTVPPTSTTDGRPEVLKEFRYRHGTAAWLHAEATTPPGRHAGCGVDPQSRPAFARPIRC